MSNQDRSQSDADMEQRVKRASAGEPEAGVRAESAESTDSAEERRAVSTSEGDTPHVVRDEDSRAASERVRRMQQEGKGMGGTPTDGRSDVVDEEAIEDATRGEG